MGRTNVFSSLFSFPRQSCQITIFFKHVLILVVLAVLICDSVVDGFETFSYDRTQTDQPSPHHTPVSSLFLRKHSSASRPTAPATAVVHSGEATNVDPKPALHGSVRSLVSPIPEEESSSSNSLPPKEDDKDGTRMASQQHDKQPTKWKKKGKKPKKDSHEEHISASKHLDQQRQNPKQSDKVVETVNIWTPFPFADQQDMTNEELVKNYDEPHSPAPDIVVGSRSSTEKIVQNSPGIVENIISCLNEKKLIHIEVYSANLFPTEISWNITDFTKNEVNFFSLEKGYESSKKLHVTHKCVDSKGCYQFSIHHDSLENRTFCNSGAWYKLLYDKIKMLEGCEFKGNAVSILFGKGCSHPLSSTDDPFISPVVVSHRKSLELSSAAPVKENGDLQAWEQIFTQKVSPVIDVNSPGAMSALSLSSTPFDSSSTSDNPPSHLPSMSLLPVTSPIRTCGGGNRGNGVCSDPTLCCSQFGYCGTSPVYCDGNDSSPSPGPSPTPPIVGTCGDGHRGNGVCSNSTWCCSQFGYCGTSSDYCPGPGPSPTPAIQCGGGNRGNGVCSDTTLCCSEWGWCGDTSEHCSSRTSSPTLSQVPTNSKSMSPSITPSASQLPSTSEVPTTAPTTRIDLIAVDEYHRRYFPRIPIAPFGSFQHLPLPNCTASPSREERVGCVGVVRSIKYHPEWAGKIHFQPPYCTFDQNGKSKKCGIDVPMSRNTLSTPIQVKRDRTALRLRLVELSGGNRTATSIVAADVDGNGATDVIIGNDRGNNQILLNNQGRDGVLFKNPVDLPGGDRRTYSIATADINGDGSLDIIIGNYRKENNQVLLSNGEGSFNDYIEISGSYESISSVAAADIDEDGRIDIIIGNNGVDNNQLLFNRGDGLFTDAVDLPGENMDTTSVAVADFDNDGRIDVIFGNKFQTNQLFLNQGNRLFRTAIELPGGDLETYSIAAADIDGDGNIDILIGNAFTHNQVLFSKGNGFFENPTILPGGDKHTTAIASADIDGDGSVDIIIGNFDSYHDNQILLNKGDRSFHDPIELEGSDVQTNSVAAADFDGDRTIDIIIGNGIEKFPGHHQMWLKPPSKGSFRGPIRLPGAEIGTKSRIAVADIDGDGDIDIVYGNYDGKKSQIVLNKGDGSFSDTIDLPGRVVNDVPYIAVADINGDGSTDIIVGVYAVNEEQVGASSYILMNNGYGSFKENKISELPGGNRRTTSIAVADIDGDGSMDLVVGNGNQRNEIFLNKGNGTFSDPIELPGGEMNTWTIAVADLNGDKNIDIIIGNGNQRNEILLNSGDDSRLFKDAIALPGGELATDCVTVADIDGDGAIDIVVGNYGGENQVLINRGDGSFNDTFSLPGGNASRTTFIAVADIDGDEHIDIIVGGTVNNQIFMNEGHGIFNEAVDLPGAGSDSIAVADIDNDNIVDLIVGTGKGSSNHVIHYLPPACPSGSGRLHAASWCFDCPSYMIRDASSTCRECLPDHMPQQNITEQLCRKCSVLSYRNFGEDECISCPNGTYYDNRLQRVESDPSTWNDDRCVKCNIGEYSNTEESAVNQCFKCLSGTIQPKPGSSSCQKCATGSFQPMQGQAWCEPCPRGGYCNASSAVDGGYRTCPPGTHNNQLGQGSQGSCLQCARGTYADKPGMTDCITCPYRLSSAGGSDICFFCAPGFYLKNASSDHEHIFKNPSENCFECPEFGNGTCPFENTTLQTLVVPFGFWRASPDTARMYKCESISCTGSQNNSMHSHRQNEITRYLGGNTPSGAMKGSYCLEEHTGPLCEVCTDQKTSYFSRLYGRCMKCPPISHLIIRIVIAFLVIFLSIAFTHKIASTRLQSFIAVLSSIGFQTKMKTLVSFYQVASSMDVVYGVKISSKLVAWLNVFQYLSFDIFDLMALPKSCIGSMRDQMIVSVTWPFVLVFLVGGTMFGYNFYKTRDYSQLEILEPSQGGHTVGASVNTGIRHRLIYIFIVVLYFTIPIVSRGIFDAIKCRPLKLKDYGEPPLFASYLLVDMSIECNPEVDDEYRSIQGIFWASFAIWPILTPIVFLFILFFVNESIKGGSITPLANACRFLWDDYEESAWFWDVIDLWRKIFLSGFIMFIDKEEGSTKVLRLIIASMVSTLYLGILAVSHPYKRQNDLYLAFVSNFLLVCCFVSGIILRHCDEGDDDTESCNKYIGLSLSSYRASIVFVTSLVGMLLAAISSVVIISVNANRMPAVLLSSGNSPNLEMTQTCTFHAFMSHVWSTGQAKTHAIVRKLQLHLPKLKIWLDVSHLEDIAKLEEHVAGAEVFILFYTTGYFQSKNCRRELYKAVQSNKPFIVLYEGNESVIEALHEECTAHCVGADSPGPAVILQHMFGTDFSTMAITSFDDYKFPPILWLDQHELCAAVLNKIYLRIFSELPHYQRNPHELANGIEVPGELGHVVLRQKVNLLFCGANEGSEQLVDEIVRSLPEKESSFVNIINAASYFQQKSRECDAPEDEIGLGPSSLLLRRRSSLLLRRRSSLILHRRSTFEQRRRSSLLRNRFVDDDDCDSTVLLLYLNNNFFKNDENNTLHDMIKRCIEDEVKIVLVHEQDSAKGGCSFDLFFNQVPQDLIYLPYQLFKDMAIPLYSIEDYRMISLRQIVRQFNVGTKANSIHQIREVSTDSVMNDDTGAVESREPEEADQYPTLEGKNTLEMTSEPVGPEIKSGGLEETDTPSTVGAKSTLEEACISDEEKMELVESQPSSEI